MEKVFNPTSWNIKRKNINLNNVQLQKQNNIMTEQIELVFLNPIYFDNKIRIDIELEGSINLKLNTYNMQLNSTITNNHCIIINNNSLECTDLKTIIESSVRNSLNLSFNSDTIVKKFTITQDTRIDSCNPLN
jgi:hypothetical protein|uniref:Uncharacterized protein n=1 Tax=viral metagenome TaxID=1070528 RepID=A0A6C0IV38_9ZZZZ